MRYVEVGGLRLSAVGLGTWQFGSGVGLRRRVRRGRGARQSCGGALDLGITLFDTAEIYALRPSERILGAALAGRRDEAFVATKIFPVLPVATRRPAAGPGERRRLGIDGIDLYQCTSPTRWCPSPTMAAFAQLLDEGLIRHAGVSNYSLARWQQAEAALGRPVLSNQVRFNLRRPRPERELLPWAQANDRLVIAYSPLAQGLLSGRYDADHRPRGSRARTPAFLPENLRRARPSSTRCDRWPRRTTPRSAQVALAWLIRRPNVVVIPGASSVAQARGQRRGRRPRADRRRGRRPRRGVRRLHAARGPRAGLDDDQGPDRPPGWSPQEGLGRPKG